MCLPRRRPARLLALPLSLLVLLAFAATAFAGQYTVSMGGAAPGNLWETANYWTGRVIVWDLYVLAVVMAYVAFVGAWHTWERLTGRMELERHREPPAPDQRG